MSTDFPPAPSTEARVQALERLYISLNARVEQLSQDMTASFRQSVSYQEQRFNQMEQRFNQLETNLASAKDEILGAFGQLLDVVRAQFPAKEE